MCYILEENFLNVLLLLKVLNFEITAGYFLLYFSLLSYVCSVHKITLHIFYIRLEITFKLCILVETETYSIF